MAGLAAVGLVAMSTPTLAAFPPAINLSELNGSNGFAINGINEDDLSGSSVSVAGDVNGDGIEDFIIGAPSAGNRAGESYVVFGRTTGFPAALNLSELDGSNGFVINGIEAIDMSGRSVSAAGDVNGDGIDDVIIGAPNAGFVVGYDDIYTAGESYVVFGRTTGFPAAINLSELDGSNGFVIKSAGNDDSSGSSVSAAGDINGDGIDDVIIGAPGALPTDDFYGYNVGESYVVFGRTSGFPAAVNLSELDGSNGFVIKGSKAFEYSGRSVSAAGDVNGDGIDDVIIGAPGANHYAGGSYVVFGGTAGFPAALNLSELDGSNGFVIKGTEASEYSGWSVSDAGDVNGDGIDDVIIGVREADPSESYVVFGRTTGFPASIDLSELDGSNGFAINGIDESDHSGPSVSAAGDVNGDGIADVIIGAREADPNGIIEAGQSYVVFGRTTGFPSALNLSELDGSNGFVINGIAEGDDSGRSVSAAGDVNGDGIADVIIGASAADPNGVDKAGQSYVVFGRGDAAPKVNDYVTFEPDPSTYTFTQNATGCPSGFVGKFGFEAQLTNVSQSTLSDLQVEVAELSNGNLLLTSDGTIGVGGVFTVPREDGYSDGFLTSSEYVDVPFDVCLINPDPFSFFVDVRGVVEKQ
jgi:hypothetical protein